MMIISPDLDDGTRARQSESTEDSNIYISIPRVYENPSDLEAFYRKEIFVPSGWMLDQSMAGSRWYNFYTGYVFVVKVIKQDRWKQFQMFNDLRDVFREHLGIWRDGHYQVEHWARVDHLAAVVEYRWRLFNAAFHGKICKHYLDEVHYYLTQKPGSEWNANATWKKRKADEEKRAEIKALADAKDFALRNDIRMTLEDINANRTGQLVLF